MIFWILAWLLVDFRPIYYTLVFIWMIAGGTFMAVPIAFWLVGVKRSHGVVGKYNLPMGFG